MNKLTQVRAPKRVVIVDDSPTLRRLIRHVLSASPELEVVGEAGDAYEARQVIKAVEPDVITLDVEMPGMSGIDFLARLMRLRPLPVVMLSSLTQPNTEQSIKALSIGAIDVFGKPGIQDQTRWASLPQLVYDAASCRPAALQPSPAQPVAPAVPQDRSSHPALIALGASTGGVQALETVLRGFPALCPPTVIVQHMPEGFLASFAQRLNARLPFSVSLVADGVPPIWGQVYLAPGGEHHIRLAQDGKKLLLSQGAPVSGHRPSVDVFFESVAVSHIPAVAALLTGMGRDGAAGLLSIKRSGRRTFAQSEASCVVYGMPKAAVHLGAVDHQLPLNEISGAVLKEVQRFSPRRKIE